MWISSIRNRVIVVAILVAGALTSLWHHRWRTTTPERPGQIVNLGLDLQGGIHLALELDQRERVSDDPARDIQLALAVLRKRIDEFGVAEPLVQQVGDHRIIVELPGVRDPDRARAVVQRTASLEFRFTVAGGALERAFPGMDRVLRGLGVADTGRVNPSSAVASLLGEDTAQAARGYLAARIQPSMDRVPGEFLVEERHWREVDSLLRLPEIRRLVPRGIELRWGGAPEGEWRALYTLDDRPVITGANLVDARAEADPLTGASQVSFELDRPGARKFGDETGRRVGQYLAILLDGRVQGRPPVVESRIDRQGRIQMAGKPLLEAQDLALTLRAGALPLPLTIVEQREVGPSLGEDSIRGGVTAGLVGTLLVIAIVLGYYAGSGLLAVVALAVYTLLCFGTLALFGAALTLPGLAGFVLSIGMAVDANVLIFERIREEVAAGKGNRAAVSGGFQHAMPAIIDSNLTTVLTALFLYRFGTGPVRGFAVTLIVGVLASMVTAVFVTRTLYLLWLRRKTDDAPLSLGRWRPFRNARFDFVGTRRVAAALTVAVLLVGLAGGALRGPQYGVDFAGGTLHQVETAAPVDPGVVRQALAARGIEGAEVQRFGSPRELVIRAPGGEDLEAAKAGVSAALDDGIGADRFRVTRSEAVGPKVGAELRAQAAAAILFSFVAVLAYLAWRFEWRFGLAAIVATAHDLAITLGMVLLFGLEINLVIVAALLTVVGYSLNDTIVIFDRIRERLRHRAGLSFDELLNQAINETLPRTLLTGGTALLTLAALGIFGGAVIRPFAWVMTCGILVGTFSSIYVAPPVLRLVTRWRPMAPVPLREPPRIPAS